ncbi:hypothetical protein [Maricaulis sp.]|uniref:hypothetical protein n=1 Tax=Maricaulis sp. TaxID=1486257 RepID=UPI002633EC94|nr:hypothetical protein [Maricaulis sp.]
MPPSARSSAKLRRIEYLALIGVLLALLAYTSFWGVLDLAVRMAIWPHGLVPFDAYDFTASLSPLSVAVFYVWWLTKPVIAVLLVLRQRLVFVVALAGLAANLMDYILLAANNQFDASGTWMFTFAAEVLLVSLIWRQRRRLV